MTIRLESQEEVLLPIAMQDICMKIENSTVYVYIVYSK